MHGTYTSPLLGTHHTHDGGSVEVTRRGIVLDLHVRDAAGRSVATVEMDEGEASGLLSDLLDAYVPCADLYAAYEEGYRDGIEEEAA